MRSGFLVFVSGLIGACCFASTDTGKVESQRYKWDNVTIVGGGFVSGILFHPGQKDLAYARTDIGGAYRWDPRRRRWTPLLDWIQRPDWNLYGIESIGLDPSDPKRLYLACGTYMSPVAGNGAILRSTDQGRSFARTDMPFKMGGNQDGRSMGERLAVDPNKNNILYFGSRAAGLWKSEDFGTTWNKDDGFPISGPTNGIGIGFEVFDARSGTKGKPTPTIYVGVASTKTGLFQSIDAGGTWTAVQGQPTGIYPHHAAVDADGGLVLTYANGPGPNGLTDGAVWKFEPKSSVWTDISPAKPNTGAEHGFGYAGLSLDIKHPGTMVVTTLDRWSPGDDVFRTTDGGSHWTSLKSSAQLDCSSSPFLFWGQKSPKFGWWMGTVQIDPYRPGHILFGTGATIWGTDEATNVDNDKPTRWSVRAQGLEETAVIDLISPPQGAHLFSALGDIGGFRHDDLKAVPPDGMQSNPRFNNTDSTDFAEHDPKVMVRVGRASAGEPSGGFSIDGGRTWKPFSSEPTGSRGGGHVAISADGKTIVWTPNRIAPSFTSDFGVTWSVCSGAPTNMAIVADRQNPQKFYGFDGRSGSFFVSVDSGANFRRTIEGLPTGNSTLRTLPGIDGDLWLVTGKELFHSSTPDPQFVKFELTTDVSTVGFGKSAPGKSYPSIFMIGAVNGIEGAFRSDDEGKSWICITDSQHGFGTMDHIIGDPRIYGRVYIGMNGRGVLFGDPSGQ